MLYLFKIFISSIIAFQLIFFVPNAHSEPAANFGPKKALDNTSIFNDRLKEADASYPVGESLLYDIRWMGIPIGKGQVELLQSEENMYLAKVDAKANDFLNSFFPVEDKLISNFRSDGFSEKFQKNVQEGTYRANEVVTFDYANNLALYESLTSGSEKEFVINSPLHDVISAFYWIRNQPISTYYPLTTRVFNDEKIWDLEFHVKRITTIRLASIGKVEAILLEPEAIVDGKRVGKGKIRIYISNDSKRVPLLVKLSTPFGPVTGMLSK